MAWLMLGAPRGRASFRRRDDAIRRIALGLGFAGTIGIVGLSAAARARARLSRTADVTPDSQEPDVLLDVTELEVDKINLEVEDLRAHVAILAELGGLLNLSVGVDARLERVKLEIEGVKAKALLKARLENVRAILEKALDTIAENPEILRIVSQSLDRVARESLQEASATLSEVLDGLEVGAEVDEALIGRLEEVRAIHEDLLGRREVGSGSSGRLRRALPGDASNDVA
jgi:hypothetical protein